MAVLNLPAGGCRQGVGSSAGRDSAAQPPYRSRLKPCRSTVYEPIESAFAFSHRPWMFQSAVAYRVPGFLIFKLAVAAWLATTGPLSAPSADSPWAQNS